MTPYLLMLGFPGVLAIPGPRRALMLFLLVALTYWLMIGFRFHVGMDWNNYIVQYNVSKGNSLGELALQTEPGFHLLFWIAHQTGGDIFLVNAVSALVFCWGFFAVARRFHEPFLAIVVATPMLVVAFAMSGTRQAMALGVIFYLYAVWEDRGTLGRFGLVLLASLFHFSAVFLLIFVALSSHARRSVKIAALAGASLIGLVIFGFAPTPLAQYTQLYISDSRLEAPGALAHVGVVAVPALVYFMIRRRWREINGDNLLYRNLAIGALLALPAVLISSVAAYRLALYFVPMQMYVWSGVPALIGRSDGRVLYRALVVSASGALLIGWLTLANNSFAWLPYRTWLL